MKTVGVREFRDQATSLMNDGETLVIERYGQPIGFFVPVVAKDRRAGHEALGRLGDLVKPVDGHFVPSHYVNGKGLLLTESR